MKVYGIFYGDEYEGPDLQGNLFFNHSSARERALQLVAEKNIENERMRVIDVLAEGETSLWPEFTETKENVWTSGFYEISIIELTIE